MRLAGIVLDLYDDAKGLILRQKTAESGRPLPEKLASARLLPREALDALPDRLFAMVATNDGDVVRKYAMHDEAHLATSLIYFLECGHLLPKDAQQKIAMNLINGCSWYQMDPPDAVVKRAMIGPLGALTAGLGVMDMASKAREGSARGRANMDAFRQAQASGTKTASGRTIELSMSDDHQMQEGNGPESGHIWDALDQFSKHDATHRKLDEQLSKRDQVEPVAGGYPGRSQASPVSVKKADLIGTEIMPQSTLRSKPMRSSPSHKLDLPAKSAAAKIAKEVVPRGWWECGDITNAEPPVTIKAATYRSWALPHLQRYPLDTVSLVKEAMAYFDEHLYSIPLPERRIYAQAVAGRADELGVKIAGAVLDYAGNEYGPFLTAELQARINRFEGTDHDVVYEVLRDKRANIEPAVMAEMLREADLETGAAKAYGRPGVGFMDPYAAVYGSRKLAAENDGINKADLYSWSEGNDYVSGIQLTALAQRGLKLDELFGKEFADSFQKDPVGIFKSMPSPQKVVLSRLASDNSAGTFKI